MLSAPVVVARIAVGSSSVEPLDHAASMSWALRRAMVAAKRNNRHVDTPASSEPEYPHIPHGSTVHFDCVTFGCDEGGTVIEAVSFSVPEGTTTAIVGPRGSGNTTLLRLSARFYEPDSVASWSDDFDEKDIGTETVLDSFSLVFQDVYLFDQRVLYNIRVGKREATNDEVCAAARTARVDEIIERLPDGWDTRVGEAGTSLSEV